MIRLRCLIFVIILFSSVQTYALTGSWRGDLIFGQMKLNLIFNFSEDNSGATLCTIDSPSQGARGIPTTVSFCSSDSVSIECKAIGAAYSGRISGQSITGTFSQRGYSFPLNLAPETPVEERRPQTPRPPFPYSVTDTVFTAADGAVMSSTLTMPLLKEDMKVPVVLMVTGSGPQNRDEEILEHRPFAVIADWLARNGIGSLRYDDRGTAKSTGDFRQATTETFKEDAHSGISFLRTLPQVGSVGILGHSEGGTIAFMLGADGVPDFIISLAGMALSGKETLMMQNSHGLDLAGMGGQDKENSLRLVEQVFDTMAEQNRNGISKPVDVDSILAVSGLTVNPQIVASIKMTQKMRTPWFDAFLNLNPRVYLGDIKCPVLAINGEKDTQVDGRSNIDVIQKYIPQAETRLLPGLNHLMQHCTTGESSEYGDIRETISPEVLKLISDFVKGVQPGSVCRK